MVVVFIVSLLKGKVYKYVLVCGCFVASLWKELKRINNYSLLPDGYRVNKWIFKVSLAVVGLFLIFAGLSLPGDKAYFSCKPQFVGDLSSGLKIAPFSKNDLAVNTGCENPFYLSYPCPFVNTSSCQLRVVQPGGVLGSQPGMLYNLALPLALLVMFLAAVLNHFLYNRGWHFENNNL